MKYLEMKQRVLRAAQEENRNSRNRFAARCARTRLHFSGFILVSCESELDVRFYPLLS